jgi:hypothetical protein
MTKAKPSAMPKTMTTADARALADRLERDPRRGSDAETAAELIRSLLHGRAAGDVITLEG